MPKKTVKKPIVTRKQKIAAANVSEYSDGAGGSISNGNVTVEYLENPVQSNDDKNKYRVIKLCNGLTALLISSPGDIWSQDHDAQTDSTDNVKSDKSDTKKDYNDEWIDKIMIKAKKESVRATCGLSINVGSFSDPPHVPCVSRILSRVILRSSKKYPQVNSFKHFLERNQGTIITAPEHCELTSFFFDVPLIHLHDAIDRFTNCFTNSALQRDAIMKEKDFKEIEYNQYDQFFNCNGQKDRLFNALASSTDSHPGNTLGRNYGPALFRKTRERLWEEVNKFMKRHYSANRMTVVLEAATPLDSLELYARKYFSKIPNNELPPIDLSPYSYDRCFKFSAFNMLYEMDPACNVGNRIEFNWPMPSPRALYRSKPHRYISWLIKNEGQGSLISYLRKKNWCTAINSGIGKTNFEDNTVYSLFYLSLDLTTKGIQNQKEILDAVYSLVNFLKLEGMQKRLYDETRRIEEARFRTNYDEQWGDPYGELCNNMHYCPSIDYLTANILYYDYDPKTIKICLDCMSPEKANITLYGKNMTGLIWSPHDYDSDSEDEKLDEFKKIAIPKDWIKNWKKIAPLPFFQLPDSNIFCPDDFTLVPLPNNSPRYPVKLHSDSLYEVWHKLDDTFRKPECRVFLLYNNDASFESAENAAMLRLFVNVLRQLLHEKLLAAIVVGMTYQIDSCHTGIMIQGSGFNKKLPLLMQTIGGYIRDLPNLVSEKLFHATRNNQLAEYYNNCVSTDALAIDVQFAIVRPFHRTNVEQHAAISGVKFEKFKHFVRSYIEHVYVQSLVQGNIGESDALDIVRDCVGMSKCGPPVPNTTPKRGIMVMPRGARCCRVQNLNPHMDIAYVTNYYQFGEKSILMMAAIDLMAMVVENPMFAIPRLRERLDDYRISARRDFSCLVGYSLAAKNFVGNSSVASLELKIENYRRALGKMMKEMAPIEWGLVKSAFNKHKLCADTDLHDEMCRNWTEITSREYIFDRHIREAEAIAQIDIEDLRAFIVGLTTSGPNNRKLSIQTVGHTEFKGNKTNKDGKYIPSPNELKLKLLTDSPGGKEEKSDYYITDIASYKCTLETYDPGNTNSVHEIVAGVESCCHL